MTNEAAGSSPAARGPAGVDRREGRTSRTRSVRRSMVSRGEGRGSGWAGGEASSARARASASEAASAFCATWRCGEGARPAAGVATMGTPRARAWRDAKGSASTRAGKQTTRAREIEAAWSSSEAGSSKVIRSANRAGRRERRSLSMDRPPRPVRESMPEKRKRRVAVAGARSSRVRAARRKRSTPRARSSGPGQRISQADEGSGRGRAREGTKRGGMTAWALPPRRCRAASRVAWE